MAAVDAAFAAAARAGKGVLGTLRLGATPAARYEIRPMLLARLREQHPGIEVDASEATTGHLCRELLSRRLDVAIGFCVEPVPGLDAAHARPRADVRPDAAGPPAVPRVGGRLEAFSNDRFVVPGAGLNTGFNRGCALSARCAGSSRGRCPPASSGTTASGRPGDDVVALATERVARNAPSHMRWARLVPEQTMPIDLVWREDDDSPVLKTFLEVATPAPAGAP